jgi:uncharacterized protein (UPF0264 family)
MRLLVSVANAAEAREAVDGGADLIDAKNPSRGALGAVNLSTLREIHTAVAGQRIVSAALGDADDEAAIEREACEFAATGVAFVKIGFAGITSPTRVEQLITSAVRGVRAHGSHCSVVAVAYADSGGTTSIDPTALIDAAAVSAATGVLLDTARKEGPGLLELLPFDQLAQWVAHAHDRRLTVALAGKLTADDLPVVYKTGADIVGVRGAVCASGRSGPVVKGKIQVLKATLLSPFELTLR